jgi:hypothetical protein
VSSPPSPWPKPCARMIGMLTFQMQVRLRHRSARMSWRAIFAPGGRQSKPARHLSLTKQLPPDLETQQLAKGGGNGVTYLPMSRSPVSYNLIVIRERLQPGELLDRECPISPMKWSCGRPRFGLNGLRWMALGELEEE